MDDLLNQMQNILSDPESMKQIQELAEMLSDNNETDSDKSDNKDASENKADNNDNLFSDIDISKIIQLVSIIGSGSSSDDPDTALLLALKPHLKEEKQKKVDKAIKFLKIYTLFISAKESGILKDFI